jgi:hypothetical protein
MADTSSTGAAGSDATADGPDAASLAADLRTARERKATLDAEIGDYGESTVTRVADAVAEARRLYDRYEDSATGSGDFEAYLEFQSQVAELVEGLPEDLPERDAFEQANDVVDQRRLSKTDIARAREAIEPAAEVAALLEDRDAVSERVREAERAVERRVDTIEERIDHLERLQELGDADLDAPVEELTDPIARYDEAVADAFESFRGSAPAREVLGFVATTSAYPFVEFDQPPADLREFVEDRPVGEESITKLLSYADYSTSKLDHYVDDTDAFRRAVPMNRTYLDRLDAAPLLVGSPPPAADRLRPFAEELIPVVARFADEDVVVRAREVRDLTDRDDYERLRTAAVARAELTDAERARLQSGDVAAELEALREDRQTLETVLDET